MSTISESDKLKDELNTSISDLKTEIDSLSIKLPYSAKSSIKRKFTIDGTDLVKNKFLNYRLSVQCKMKMIK